MRGMLFPLSYESRTYVGSGIFLGFLTVWIVDHSWRALLASAAIPALIMLFLVFLCPESPRLLIRRGDYHAAFGVLCQLRPTEVQAARDLFYIHSQLQKEAALIEGQKTPDQQAWRDSRSGTPLEHPLDQAGDDRYLKMIQKSSYPHRVGALWKIPRNRNACIAAFIVMASQQLCGVGRPFHDTYFVWIANWCNRSMSCRSIRRSSTTTSINRLTKVENLLLSSYKGERG